MWVGGQTQDTVRRHGGRMGCSRGFGVKQTDE